MFPGRAIGDRFVMGSPRDEMKMYVSYLIPKNGDVDSRNIEGDLNCPGSPLAILKKITRYPGFDNRKILDMII